MREAGRSVLSVVGPAVTALLLTLPFATRSPLWADEVDSVDAAQRSWHGLATLLGHQDGPLGLYYGVLHVWLSVAGSSELAVRLPSVLGAVLAVALVADTARLLGGPRAAALSGLLLASSPLVATYGLDARPYALELACAAGLLRVLVGGGEYPSRRRRATYAGLLVVGVGLQLFLLLVLPAHLLALWRSGRPVRPWLAPAAVALAALIPLLLLSAGQTAEVGYLHRPGVLTVPGWLQAMSGSEPWVAVPALVLGFLVLRYVPTRGRPLGLAVLLVPGAVLIAVSVLHPLFLNRYVLASCVGTALLVGVGAARGRPWHGAAAVGLIVVSAATAVSGQLRPSRYEDLRAGTDMVLDASRQGDAVVYAPATVRAAAAYYLGRGDLEAPRPRDVAADPARDEVRVGNFGGLVLPPDAAVNAVLQHPRVWRLSWDNPSAQRAATDRSVLALLQSHYDLTLRSRFGQLLVEEYVRHP